MKLLAVAFMLVAGCVTTNRPANYRGEGKDTEGLRWQPRTQGTGEIVLAPEFAGATPLIVTRIAE